MSLNLDPNEIEIQESYDNTPIPAGDYVVICEKAVDEPNRQSQQGASYSRVNLQFRILEGEHANKCLFHAPIYNHSSSEKATKIGCEFLVRLHKAAGCDGNVTPESLQSGKPVSVRVKIQEGAIRDASTGERYAASNAISSVSALAKEASAKKPSVQPW